MCRDLVLILVRHAEMENLKAILNTVIITSDYNLHDETSSTEDAQTTNSKTCKKRQTTLFRELICRMPSN